MLIQLLVLIFEIYFWLLVVRIILSWFPGPYYGYIGRIFSLVYRLTEPYLALFRFIPVVNLGGVGIDFSPIIAIIVLRLLERALLNILGVLFSL